MSKFFLGDQSELDRKLERENMNKSNDEMAREIQARASKGRITDKDDEELSEDLLKRLKRTRIINKDLYDVYMVPDPNYYDPYYNNPEGIDSNPILAQARTIKRVYKTYPEYLTAVAIREAYMDYIVEKYGGWDRYVMMKKVQAVNEWMPPNPIYSKMAYDRHIVDYGMFISPDEVEIDDDSISEWIDDRKENLHTNPLDLEVKFDIFTDIKNYNNEILKNGTMSRHGNDNSNRRRVLNAADVDDLNNIVKSWYVSEDDLKSEETKKEVFALSPENIRKRYFQSTQLGDPERFKRIMETGEAIDEYDPNELVIDDSTGRTMKASELKRRQTIRQLAKYGWDEIALLQESGTASNHEINMMKRAKKNKKKAKRYASTAASDLLGIDAMSMMQDSAYDIFGPDIAASIFNKGEK